MAVPYHTSNRDRPFVRLVHSKKHPVTYFLHFYRIIVVQYQWYHTIPLPYSTWCASQSHQSQTTMEVVPSSLLESLLQDTASPRAIAMTRCRLLKHDGVGLPSILHHALEESLQAFAALLLKDEDSSDASVHVLNDHFCTKALHTVLRIHLQCSQYDACLADELALQGTHLLIRRIIQWEPARKLSEQNIETMMELQDVACEIAALYKSFPRNRAPYPREVLVQRLPLSFRIQPMEKDNHARDKVVASLHSSESHTEELVLIHQVEQRQSAQQDVGFGKCMLLLLLLILLVVQLFTSHFSHTHHILSLQSCGLLQ